MGKLMLCFGLLHLIESHAFAEEKISAFGKYQGYSQEEYHDYIRTSDYLRLSDGTRLAYDLLLPSNGDQAASGPFPVLFSYTSYLRAYRMVKDGKVVSNDVVKLNPLAKAFIWLRSKVKQGGDIFDQGYMNKWLKRMLKHGYAVAIVEQRGTGASEGVMMPIFKYQALDANEVINWIAQQPWSNGKIGMFGKSSLAMAQYAAASAGNPHLKAIFPSSAGFDMYSSVWFPGGIYNRAFAKMFASSTGTLETMAVPVDRDTDGRRLAEIVRHRQNAFDLSKGPEVGIKNSPYRDSVSSHPKGGKIWEDLGLFSLLDRMNQSETAVYNESGWLDIFSRDAVLLHNNLKSPRKLMMRPLDHFSLGKKGDDIDWDAEAHRWFDYWLKGIENGIMAEAPVHYYMMGKNGENWQESQSWPVSSKNKRFYLAQGNKTHNRLVSSKPVSGKDPVAYPLTYEASTGINSRWNSILKPSVYPEMSAIDEKALTFTTEPLKDHLQIAGHPVIKLTIFANINDLDLFVYLEEVDHENRSRYITEGCLRASHRNTGHSAPYDNLMLPYHRGNRSDMTPLKTGHPEQFSIDLLPVAYRFEKGNRIRLSITGADRDNFETPEADPGPVIQVYVSGDQDGFIDLPFVI